MKNVLLLVLFATAILITMAVAVANCTRIQPANGTTLSLEAPPPPALYMNGTMTNLSADDLDRDLAIDPTDELPANGTQIMSTAGATDMDINEFPPVGVSVIIQNDTITVTNHTVDINTELQDEAAQQAVESDLDNGDSSDGDDE